MGFLSLDYYEKGCYEDAIKLGLEALKIQRSHSPHPLDIATSKLSRATNVKIEIYFMLKIVNFNCTNNLELDRKNILDVYFKSLLRYDRPKLPWVLQVPLTGVVYSIHVTKGRLHASV